MIVIPLAISAVIIGGLFWWIRRYKKLTMGEGIFYATLILIVVVLVWLKLGG